jgi:hypothetical protein
MGRGAGEWGVERPLLILGLRPYAATTGVLADICDGGVPNVG